MSLFSGKEMECVSLWMAATDATSTRLTARTENVGQKMYADDSSPKLFDDLCAKTINKQTVLSIMSMKNL
jgi:hypothetical protein